MEDEQIIQKLFSRDESGLSAIETAYGGQLHNLALQICGNRQDAEEVMNDTLRAAWDAIPPERPRMLFAYLAGITRHLACKALRYRRAEKRAETVPFDAVMEEILPAFADGDENTAASDNADIVLALNAFLDSCSETDRAVFVRRYYTAEPVQKIADALGLTKDNVYQKLHRMRDTLACQLKEKGVHL